MSINNKGLLNAYAAVYDDNLREQKEIESFANDIFATISISMVSEGFTLDEVLQYFASEETNKILEKYQVCEIVEGVVTEEFFCEQFEYLYDELNEGVKDKLNPVTNIVQALTARGLTGLARKFEQRGTSAAQRELAQRIRQRRFPQSSPSNVTVGQPFKAPKPSTTPSGKPLTSTDPTKGVTPVQGKQSDFGKFVSGAGGMFKGGVRNVLGAPIVTTRLLASKLPGGAGMRQTLQKMGKESQFTKFPSKSGETGKLIQAQGQRAVDFIKKKIAPVAAAAGTAAGTFGAGSLYGGGQKEKELGKGQGTIVVTDPSSGEVRKVKIQRETQEYDMILNHLLENGYASTQKQAKTIIENMGEKWKQSILG